jgi:hypothetical protein
MGSGGTHRINSSVICPTSVGMLPVSLFCFSCLYPQTPPAPSQTAALFSEVAASVWLFHLHPPQACQQPHLCGDRPDKLIVIHISAFTWSPTPPPSLTPSIEAKSFVIV